jgi:protease-4
MSINADTLLDRIYLKGQISRWRIVAIVALVSVVLLIAGRMSGNGVNPLPISYIARVSIEGVMLDDPKRDELLVELKNDSRVKAVIVRLDTPGGTAIAGEEVYLKLREIAAVKPVVAVMRTMSTSAGYMAALGADYIIARSGTITGSIGVLMQSAEFTGLAEKLGIKPITIKSSPLKATPSPMEKFTPQQEAAIQSVINSFYDHFVLLVAERRNFTKEQALIVSDGRVYTGTQALDNKLIDALGGEDEALVWLQKNKKISDTLDVKDVKPQKESEGLWQGLSEYAGKTVLSELFVRLDGLVLIWHGGM